MMNMFMIRPTANRPTAIEAITRNERTLLPHRSLSTFFQRGRKPGLTTGLGCIIATSKNANAASGQLFRAAPQAGVLPANGSVAGSRDKVVCCVAGRPGVRHFRQLGFAITIGQTDPAPRTAFL